MYLIELGGVTYTNNGQPFTLAECWCELDGVGGARILSLSGRVVLDRAGEHCGRRDQVRQAYRRYRG